MTWLQKVTPNLDPVVSYEGKILLDWYGYCLDCVETSFGTPHLSLTAWAAWEAIPDQYKHADRNFPVGVYFLIFFSGYAGEGHVAIAFVNAAGQMGIWTSPFDHVPYYYTGYHTVDQLAKGYGVAYAGWSEMVAGVVLIEQEAAPAPAVNSSEQYTVSKTIPGYMTATDAANHTQQADNVAPGVYSLFSSASGMLNVTAKAGVPGSWINPGDNVAPAPAPAAPSAPGGSYTVIKSIGGYITSNNAANHIDQAGTVSAGQYSIFNQSSGMLNVTSKPGQPGSWINPADNTEGVAPPPKVYTENVVDGVTFAVEDGAPKAMYVTKTTGADKWNFKDVSTWRDFKSVENVPYGTEVFVVGSAHVPLPPNGGTYLMVDADFGNFVNTGNPENFYGFNQVDLSTTKPPALSAPVTAVAAVEPAAPASQISTPAVASVAPVNWTDTYVRFAQPMKYIAVKLLMVEDISGSQPPLSLPKYDPGVIPEVGVVTAYGTVTKDGVEYYRLGTTNDPKFTYWYCVPKLDPDTKTPLLLVKPVPQVTPVTKLSAVADTMSLAKSVLEEAPKFLDDIMPKWFRNKK